MIGRTRGNCAVHQAALIDFADRRERTAATSAALTHLEWCRSCEDELAGIVRTIAGLRRLADTVSGLEPGREAWPMLRDRVTRPEPQPWRWRYPLGGLIATAAVALLVLPSIGSSPVRPPTVLDEAPGYTLVDRRYESPRGALTADMVNAIAGQDVSKRARLRSAVLHIAPSSVDRDEPSRTSSAALTGTDDEAGMPVIAPS